MDYKAMSKGDAEKMVGKLCNRFGIMANNTEGDW